MEKRVFWGDKRHNREQCNDQETKYNPVCETPKIPENVQLLRREFEQKVERVSCGAG